MRRMVDFVSIGDVSTGNPSGTLQICPQHADDNALVIIGCQKDTQTADLLQLWTSAGVPVLSADANGVIYASNWSIPNSSVDAGAGYLYAAVVTATNISATTNMFAATVTATNISGVTTVDSTNVIARTITATNISGATTIKGTSIYATTVTATNISGATNLHTTNLTGTRIDITTEVNAATLTAVNISGVTNVKATSIFATTITATNISGATNLHTTTVTATRVDVTVDINAAKLTATNISGATNIFTNVLTATNISGVTNVKSTNVYATTVTATNVSGATNVHTTNVTATRIDVANINSTTITGTTISTTTLSSNGNFTLTKTQNGIAGTAIRAIGVCATHDGTVVTAAYVPVAAGKTVMISLNAAAYCSAGAQLSSGAGYHVVTTIVGTGAATAPNTIMATSVVPMSAGTGMNIWVPGFTPGGAAAVAGITFTGSADNDITWAYDVTYLTI